MADMTQALTADDVRSAVFSSPPFGKRGYQKKSVDDFLQLVARRLEGRGHLTAADVRNIVFPTPPMFKRGYNEDQVDAFLDLVVDALSR